MNDTDRNRVSAIERLYEPESCVYTAEELQASVFQRTNDFYAGKMELVPHDEIRNRLK